MSDYPHDPRTVECSCGYVSEEDPQCGYCYEYGHRTDDCPEMPIE